MRPGSSAVEPYKDLLGVKTDQEIAKLAGLSRPSVSAYRRTHNIPRTPRKSSKLDSYPLGEMTDREIAQLSGCHLNHVQWYRQQRGIPARGKRRRGLAIPDKELFTMAIEALMKKYNMCKTGVCQERAKRRKARRAAEG